VVPGVVPGAATLTEEEDSGDDGQHEASDSDVERPEEHGGVLVETDVLILEHEPKVHTQTNAHTDS